VLVPTLSQHKEFENVGCFLARIPCGVCARRWLERLWPGHVPGSLDPAASQLGNFPNIIQGEAIGVKGGGAGSIAGLIDGHLGPTTFQSISNDTSLLWAGNPTAGYTNGLTCIAIARPTSAWNAGTAKTFFDLGSASVTTPRTSISTIGIMQLGTSSATSSTFTPTWTAPSLLIRSCFLVFHSFSCDGFAEGHGLSEQVSSPSAALTVGNGNYVIGSRQSATGTACSIAEVAVINSGVSLAYARQLTVNPWLSSIPIPHHQPH
jgi:hypothetical protein